jgi:hypothetical protein
MPWTGRQMSRCPQAGAFEMRRLRGDTFARIVAAVHLARVQVRPPRSESEASSGFLN